MKRLGGSANGHSSDSKVALTLVSGTQIDNLRTSLSQPADLLFLFYLRRELLDIRQPLEPISQRLRVPCAEPSLLGSTLVAKLSHNDPTPVGELEERNSLVLGG